MMRAEWENFGPEWDEHGEDPGARISYPGDWRQAQEMILETFTDGSWGTWELTQHTIETPETPSAAALAFINRMAQFTTPEDEFSDPEFSHKGEYEDVVEYVSDMPDDRLCDEYGLFMSMVREARTIRDAQPAPVPVRVVVTVRGGVAEVADAENWPADLELYLVDYDEDEGGCFLDGSCAVNKFCADTPLADGMTGHFAKNVAEAWQHD